MTECPVPQGARWDMAYWLNDHIELCWADLVSWALYGEPESFEAAIDNVSVCRSGPDTQREGACYCGQFKACPKEVAT